jgi:gas vesicle protein
MLKEHLVDVIDELLSVSNGRKINSLLEKFDTETTKVHHMMQQDHQDMVVAHTDCVNAISDVLSGHDNGHMDYNDNIHDEGKDAKAQVVHDNVQQTKNAVMEAPLQHD